MKDLLIIIPARIGSKRLKRKNILPINGIPMVIFVANEAKKSKFKPYVCVSTESKIIIKLCKFYNINYIKRPIKLSKDKVEKQDAIVHAYKKLKKKFKPKIIVSLQANSPEFKSKHLDSAIKFFKKIFPDKKIKEVITINKQKKIMNGAFRIMMPDGVAKKTLSTNVGIKYTSYIDVHSYKDYVIVKNKIENA